MAHFARVEGGLVTEVLVISQDVVDSGMFGDPSLFVQTSYNTRGGVHYGPDGQPDGPGLRKNYAGIGYTYDPVLDAFYAPEPYPSWGLDLDTCLWVPPVPYPDDGGMYAWDEETLSWVKPTLPELTTVEPDPVVIEPAPAIVEPEAPVVEATLSTVTSSVGGQ